jgi:hypothetical protein
MERRTLKRYCDLFLLKDHRWWVSRCYSLVECRFTSRRELHSSGHTSFAHCAVPGSGTTELHRQSQGQGQVKRLQAIKDDCTRGN